MEVVWQKRSDESYIKTVEREGFTRVVNDICFRPDGLQVLVAMGNRVLVFDCDYPGELQQTLKGVDGAV